MKIVHDSRTKRIVRSPWTWFLVFLSAASGFVALFYNLGYWGRKLGPFENPAGVLIFLALVSAILAVCNLRKIWP